MPLPSGVDSMVLVSNGSMCFRVKQMFLYSQVKQPRDVEKPYYLMSNVPAGIEASITSSTRVMVELAFQGASPVDSS